MLLTVGKNGTGAITYFRKKTYYMMFMLRFAKSLMLCISNAHKM